MAAWLVFLAWLWPILVSSMRKRGIKYCVRIKYDVPTQISNGHPEWMYSIVDAALGSISRQEDDEGAIMELFTLIGNICTVVQHTAQALSKLEVLRWFTFGSTGQSSSQQDKAGAEHLMQAICQGMGAWNPAGALIVGPETFSVYIRRHELSRHQSWLFLVHQPKRAAR